MILKKFLNQVKIISNITFDLEYNVMTIIVHTIRVEAFQIILN